jgi:hypothetical protein
MFTKIFATIGMAILLTTNAGARNIFEADGSKLTLQKTGVDEPYVSMVIHDIGRINMTISNFGILGLDDFSLIDPLTGEPAPSLRYPKGYKINYLYESVLWVGGLHGTDTLVTTGHGLNWSDVREFWPPEYPEGEIIYRSDKNPEAPEYDSAVSNQDYIAVYYDTLANTSYTGFDYYTGERHRPLDIKVVQKSYAWGYDYTEDFIIFDFEISNIGEFDIDKAYIGLYVDPDIGREDNYAGGDDICGFKKAVPSKYIKGLIDTIDVIYACDNDGNLNDGGSLTRLSPKAVLGLEVLRTPSTTNNFDFNWWVSGYRPENDWGPRQRPYPGGPVRLFHGVLGTPFGDNDKYYMMSSGEFDYNQTEAARDHTDDDWLPPSNVAYRAAYGDDIKYLISCGPFDLDRGVTLPFTVAFVMGDEFYFQDRGVVMGYSKYRDFSDLGLNSVWASWVFDNPGIDTDGDGFKGNYYLTVRDSVWDSDLGKWIPTRTDTFFYTGDGIPDLNGANPPPNPIFTLFPRVDEYNHGVIEITWNGQVSETTPDQFSQQVDFEGYRVYVSLSGREDDFMLVTSYDEENYNRWEYDPDDETWVITHLPLSLRELKDLYGEDFEPSEYYDDENVLSVYNPALNRYQSYYFTPHDWNQSNLKDTTLIHKVYPDQPYPSTLDLDSAAIFYPDELTDEGKLKYFEYRYVLRNLLPAQQYYIAVTTFDHGYPARELGPQETQPSVYATREYAQNSATLVERENLNVIVYPNPYRVDGGYEDRFEGWEHPDLPREYNRAINFSNLPHKCTIRIFSIDGDLIRQINHDFPEGAPGAMHDKWDLITRNQMLAVSGIYYFTVDSELGSQIGKIVIIR